MTARVHIPAGEDTANLCVSRDGTRAILTESLDGLYLLSFLLTGNLAEAEGYFVVGLGDRALEHPAFGEWARSWAKRMIVENAIHALNPRPGPSRPSSPGTIFPNADQLSNDPGWHFEVEAILALDDFERFVFVMLAPEHYSERECALLLKCSVAEIRKARSRAFENLINTSHVILLHNQCFTKETKS